MKLINRKHLAPNLKNVAKTGPLKLISILQSISFKLHLDWSSKRHFPIYQKRKIFLGK